MKKEDLKTLSNIAIIELYEEFIRWDHYEAVDEFGYLKDLDFSRFDVRVEIFRRFGGDRPLRRWDGL